MEISEVTKLRLRCENFQDEIEITNSIFDQKIKCNFHSNMNHNLQLHKSNMKNINFCWINCAQLFQPEMTAKYHTRQHVTENH